MIFNHPTTFSNLRPQSHSSLPQLPAGGSEGATWSPSHKSSPLLPAHIISPQHYYHRQRRPSSFSGFFLSSPASHAIVPAAVIDRNQDPLPPAPAPAQPERNSFNRINNNRHRCSWQRDEHTSFPAGLEDVEVLEEVVVVVERSIGGHRSNRRQNRTSYQLVMDQLAMLDAVMESETEGADNGRLEPAVFLYGISAMTAGGAATGGSVDGPEEEEDQAWPELGLQMEEPPVPMPSLVASRRRTWIR